MTDQHDDVLLLCEKCQRHTRHWHHPHSSQPRWSCSVCASERTYGSVPQGYDYGWTTQDELRFIRTLEAKSPALLLGYRKGLGHRRVWDGLDRLTLLAAVAPAGRA